MCGITGAWDPHGTFQSLERVVSDMAAKLFHRGPDDSGVWVSSTDQIGLGHRRLAILDLTPQGRQPMLSACERFVTVFNGEIYNFLEVRVELETIGAAPAWRGHSDTEVLLAAVAHWGIEQTLKRLVGMFAIALWDRKEKTLTLARDRIGEKPLYYGRVGRTFVFGSELKAFAAHPEWSGTISRDALALYTRLCYVPSPFSIYSDVSKLPPGTLLTLHSSNLAQVNRINPVSFWSAREVVERGIRDRLALSDRDAVDELEFLLEQSIGLQMCADVPLGAFLSGGVDSSAVVAMMQKQSSRPIRTFTIGFTEPGYNEAEHAKLVAKHLGTEHTELYASSADALSVIPKLPALYDEPFSDSSQIPTFLVAQLARSAVKVSLSGDGGDELFGGYDRYAWTSDIWSKIGWLPRPLRLVLAAGISALSIQAWDQIFQTLSPLLPRALRLQSPGHKVHKLAEAIVVRNPEEMYLGFVSHWIRPSELVIGSREPLTALRDPTNWPTIPSVAERFMFVDLITYLPDDILVKVDRAAMGVSLETRVPLLDHRIVEFAAGLPLHMKIRGGRGKWLLRQVLYRHVPQDLIERPKMGFSIPLDSWLRGALRDWAEALLNEGRLKAEGYFNPEPIRKMWHEHLSGRRNWHHYLWDILMFQAWLEQQ